VYQVNQQSAATLYKFSAFYRYFVLFLNVALHGKNMHTGQWNKLVSYKFVFNCIMLVLISYKLQYVNPTMAKQQYENGKNLSCS
jgi:hypothetical protein